jgi:hypothetical protein
MMFWEDSKAFNKIFSKFLKKTKTWKAPDR